MAKTKLNFRFHNPNSNEEVIKFLIKVVAQQQADEQQNKKTQEPQK